MSNDSLLVKQTIKLLVDIYKYIDKQPVIVNKYYPQRNKEKFELLNQINLLLRKVQERQKEGKYK